jgi:hypothetical protein
MIQLREICWWYWAVTSALLFAGLAGRFEAFQLAAGLSAFQILHFRVREGSFSAFPVQVRVAYTAILLLALWESMRWLFWIPAIGTPARVLFGYCTLARCMSLLPWNRREPLSWRLVRRTFLSPPVKGNILQGLPAAT